MTMNRLLGLVGIAASLTLSPPLVRAQQSKLAVTPGVTPPRTDTKSGASAPSADAELAQLTEKLENDTNDKALASSSIPTLDRIIAGGVSGARLGTAYYLRAVAHGILGDDAGLCSDMRLAQPLAKGQKETSTIGLMLKECK